MASDDPVPRSEPPSTPLVHAATIASQLVNH